jgi:two-component system CheB/CheR fusion protein
MSESVKGNGRGRGGRKKGAGRAAGQDFLVVGIGTSAGGLTALGSFLEAVPADSGMAYVVIMHLSPEHESSLAELLQRRTALPVVQVNESVRVEPNRVYVIPPARSLTMEAGTIHVSDAGHERGPRASIDLFFRTLGQIYREHAVGVVLSGTGADGTLGLRRIKEEGGITIAQEPAEAEHDGMPRSAIADGLVDFVLPAAAMPEKLVGIREASARIRLPPEGDEPPTGKELSALRDIITTVRSRTGHDFSNYKQSTILRRVTRRMQMREVADLASYLRYLRDHPSDVAELQQDLLISVTNFFRDAPAFEYLARRVVPEMFRDKGAGDQVRVWVTGCATGEEAYSLAILLAEHAERLEQPPSVQIFATDLDGESIAQARDGVFPESISADVSVERLSRFFTKEGNYYRVKKQVRESVLFAAHNILSDPPFSRLDLVSCRNLLIYLNRETQDKVLEVFHFALRPGGFLFLGSSESADTVPELFTAADKKLRTYRRGAVSPQSRRPPALPLAGHWEPRTPPPPSLTRHRAFGYPELHQTLVEQYISPSVLVTDTYDVVHVSESAGRYLRLAGGEPSRSLLALLHPDLRLDVRAALHAAGSGAQETSTPRLRVRTDGEEREVHVVVRPFNRPDLHARFLLVIFEEGAAAPPDAAPADDGGEAAAGRSAVEEVTRRLEEELQQTRTALRATVEQYETANEEMRASNEELQAINEELRSASEELETSKEELQSLNEELQTVNHELKDKVDEVSQANADLKNLLAATDIGTIFLDRELRITRYTPRAAELFNLIPADHGRPLSDLTHRLDYADFPRDAGRVLETLERVERETQGTDGRWYAARLLPYRGVDDRIDGVVLTFTDITDRRRTVSQAHGADRHLRVLLESIEDYAIFTLDLGGLVTRWNKGAEKIFDFTEEEILGRHTEILFTPEDRERGADKGEMKTALDTGRAEDERWHLRKDGSRFYASGVMTPLDAGGELRGYVKVARDLTARERAEQERADLTRQLEEERGQLEERVRERTGELEAEIVERREAEGRVKDLLARIVSAQESERRRMARDLHDLLGQQLTALRLNLEAIHERCAGGNEWLGTQVTQAQAIASRLDSEVDFMAWELRPAALDETGLPAALEDFTHEWTEHYGVRADFHTTGLGKRRLAPEVEISLYRIAQEALNNVVKHAEAGRVDVILERRDGNVVLIVEDDGKGFDPSAAAEGDSGMGLLNMRERAALADGTLEIESEPGRGTTVFARAPAHFAIGK